MVTRGCAQHSVKLSKESYVSTWMGNRLGNTWLWHGSPKVSSCTLKAILAKRYLACCHQQYATRMGVPGPWGPRGEGLGIGHGHPCHQGLDGRGGLTEEVMTQGLAKLLVYFDIIRYIYRVEIHKKNCTSPGAAEMSGCMVTPWGVLVSSAP